MNNSLDLIKKDHEALEALFKEFEGLGEDDTAHKRRLMDKIKKDFLFHAKMEETLCYPQFREALTGENERLIDGSFTEHQEAKDMIEALTSFDEASAEFDERAAMFIDQVRTHVMEEEGTILPVVQKEVPSEVLSALGDDILTFRESHGGTMP